MLKAVGSITLSEKRMRQIWTDTAVGLLAAVMLITLGGCATSKDTLLPHSDSTMLDIWHQETEGVAAKVRQRVSYQLSDACQALRRPLTGTDVRNSPAVSADYTRNAATEIDRQFQIAQPRHGHVRVFPHLLTDPVPVPGYTTVFPRISVCSTLAGRTAGGLLDGVAATLAT